jgi:hypothetical protein
MSREEGEPVSGLGAAETGNVRKASERTAAGSLKLHGIGLLLSQVANYRQLEHQSLIGLDQQDDPDDE